MKLSNLFNQHKGETIMQLPTQKELLTSLDKALSLYSQQAINYAKNDLWTEESLAQLKQAALLTLKALQLLALVLITVCVAAIYFPLLASNKIIQVAEQKIKSTEPVLKSPLVEYTQLEINFNASDNTEVIEPQTIEPQTIEPQAVLVESKEQTSVVAIPKPPSSVSELLCAQVEEVCIKVSEVINNKTNLGGLFKSLDKQQDLKEELEINQS